MASCSAEGCAAPIRARGMCATHYMRAKRAGDIATSVVGIDCCSDHACDGCPTCRRGRCCRKDNPVYRLPEPKDWTGHVYGELGRLEEIGGGLQCHICGEVFENLGTHTATLHDVTSHEYRSYFELKRTTPLRSAEMRAKHSAAYARVIRQDPTIAARALAGIRRFQDSWTSEQRSETFSGRRERMEASRSRPAPTECSAGHPKLPEYGHQRPDGKGWRCNLCRLEKGLNASRVTLR